MNSNFSNEYNPNIDKNNNAQIIIFSLNLLINFFILQIIMISFLSQMISSINLSFPNFRKLSLSLFIAKNITYCLFYSNDNLLTWSLFIVLYILTIVIK